MTPAVRNKQPVQNIQGSPNKQGVLTPELEEYLKNKHKGGVNNQKGNTYENHYAVYEIVNLMANHKDRDKTLIGTQIEKVFIDDLVIDKPDQKIYHQIKDKQDLTWGKMEKGELLYDFTHQAQMSQTSKENFLFKIVYSHDTCSLHDSNIPSSLSAFTQKVRFKTHASLSAMVLSSPDVQENIIKIVYEFPEQRLDWITQIVEIINSVWQEHAQPNTFTSIDRLFKESSDLIKNIKVGIPNFRSEKNVILRKEVKTKLDSFQSFRYRIEGSRLVWKTSNLSGSKAVDDELQDNILKSDSSDIFSLIEILF